MIKQAKYAYSPLGKAFEVDAINSLDPSNKLK